MFWVTRNIRKFLVEKEKNMPRTEWRRGFPLWKAARELLKEVGVSFSFAGCLPNLMNQSIANFIITLYFLLKTSTVEGHKGICTDYLCQ